MQTTWKSTQFWFSVLIAGLAQWSLIVGKIDGAMWTATLSLAALIFGIRKVLEHKDSPPAPPQG